MPTDTENKTEFLVADHPIRYGTEDIKPGKTFGCDPDDVDQLLEGGSAHRATDETDEDTKEHQTDENSQTDATNADTNQTDKNRQTDSNDQGKDNVVSLFKARPEDPDQVSAAIKAVIIGLDKNESAHWNASGSPDANTITEKLGWKITAAERDAAWAELKLAASE